MHSDFFGFMLKHTAALGSSCSHPASSLALQHDKALGTSVLLETAMNAYECRQQHRREEISKVALAFV